MMNAVSDVDTDADRLINAVKDVGQAIRDGAQTISQALKEIDETLALVASRRIPTEEQPLPTAGELLERVASIGSRAVMKAVVDWEKRSGITS